MAEAGPSALLDRRSGRHARTMKHIAGTVLAAGCLALVAGALLAGMDDIRKFRRMRGM